VVEVVNVMKLIEVFLPLTDNSHWKIGDRHFKALNDELINKFGGLTIHSRSPAQGFYQSDGTVTHDDLVVLEIMTDQIDRSWWSDFR
jgi:hypothetical protein